MGNNPHSRIAYLDNLRSGLVMLVVAHHVALVYGGLAPFYYQEPPFTEPLAFLVFGQFVLFNQAWFMGALFFLAGYFTPSSYDSKGFRGFLAKRRLKLGVPLVVGMLVLEPIARTGFYLMPATLTGITEPLDWTDYPNLIGLGPFWFVLMLLLFTAGYAIWRAITGRQVRESGEGETPSLMWIVAFTIGLAVASYAWRVVVPLGQDVSLFWPSFSFPTIAYLTQYASFFVLGILAFRGKWLDGLPGWMGWLGLLGALVGSVVLYPWAISGELFNPVFSETSGFSGNGHWTSLLYAGWDSLFAVGMMLWALVVFRTVFGGGGGVSQFFARQSYGVYLIHIAVIVYVSFALKDLSLGAFAKFALSLGITLPLCFCLIFLLRRLKWARAVL